ncbi:unnamed protein product [Caenorhabditis angaria]|uniref:Uncharacterized protein n=1 Tax=Caenorhabditis angaria TaxID=860376 RepID=A0A9P1IJX3_9PELO|nr:unnamed protein product [Caenorhabditis angaria]
MSVNEAISDDLFKQLFRLFSLFADRTNGATCKPAQAEFLIDELLRELRRQTTPKVHDLPDDVTFNEFLNLLQVIFPDREDLQISTSRVFERFINHVIGKGFVLFRKVSSKKGCLNFLRKNCNSRWIFGWCQIEPGIVRLKETNGKEYQIEINEETIIEPPTSDGEQCVWMIISSPEITYQFSHLDPIQAQLFVKDMRLSKDYNNRDVLADFDYKRSMKMRPRDEKIRKELEKDKERLEVELEEERKNRLDEEIVRGLTTRLLKQEMEKSEQMQQVIFELRNKLDHENGHEATIEEKVLVKQESEAFENEEIEIILPSREDQIQQYAYHLYASQADDHITSDEEEIWKQNYNLIVSTQSV